METVYQKFNKIANNHKDRTAQCWKSENKWRSLRYLELLNNVDKLAAGLTSIGVCKGDRVAIISENRPEWLWFDLAINKLGAISVPIHTTSSKSLIRAIIKDSGVKFATASSSYLFQLLNLKNDLNIKIIAIDERGDADFGLCDILKNKLLQITSYTENDLASIIYTSGTTGNPKGVKLTNKNFLFNVDSVCAVIDVNENDKFISFLPLSHVLERTCGSYTPILKGGSIAYAESISKLSDNLREVKPTVIISVPKIFERMHEKIMAGIYSKQPPIRRFIFWAMSKKGGRFRRFIADRLVYGKIRGVMGGHLRFAVSGGASINSRILRFFRGAGVNVIEGYGLTETAPIVCCNRLENIKIGTVGQPIPGVEIKIAKDKEVLVKGANVMAGYWEIDMTTLDLFEDGWFKTGDLGHVDNENFLTIIGRKKDIIVTSNGKNIYPEKIESTLNLSPYILQSVIVGHKKKFLAAIIVPDIDMIGEMINEPGFSMQHLINKEVEKINHQLPAYEKIRNFYILDKPFCLENEELTPTLKIRRKIIENKYSKNIEMLFSRTC